MVLSGIGISWEYKIIFSKSIFCSDPVILRLWKVHGGEWLGLQQKVLGSNWDPMKLKLCTGSAYGVPFSQVFIIIKLKFFFLELIGFLISSLRVSYYIFYHSHTYPQLFPDRSPFPDHSPLCPLVVVVIYWTYLTLSANHIAHMLLVLWLYTEVGGATRVHTLLGNWLLLSQKSSDTNSYLRMGGTSNFPLLSILVFCLAWSCWFLRPKNVHMYAYVYR